MGSEMKRTIATLAVASAVVAGGATGWAFGHNNNAAAKATQSPTASLTTHPVTVATPSRSPGPASSPSSPARGAVGIISFYNAAHPTLGVLITRPTDAQLLSGTPVAFRRFIASKLTQMLDAHDCNSPISMQVGAYASSGYAIGGVTDCGGYLAIWGVRNGSWKELIASQQEWQCQDLHRYAVPPTLVTGYGMNGDQPTCYDTTSRKSVPYAG